MLRIDRVITIALKLAVVVCAVNGLSATEAWSQSRFGSHYQQNATAFCDNFDSSPCTVFFSVLTVGPLKVQKASCTILTSEGGSPSREITGASLGRLTENRRTYQAGQYLAPIQSEFAGAGQNVLNFLVDTSWVIPLNFRPAIQISRLNNAPISASCSIAGEELAAPG